MSQLQKKKLYNGILKRCSVVYCDKKKKKSQQGEEQVRLSGSALIYANERSA